MLRHSPNHGTWLPNDDYDDYYYDDDDDDYDDDDDEYQSGVNYKWLN